MDYIFRILPNMFSGLGVSAQIFIFTIVLSLPLGMLLAMVRISKVGLFRQAAGAYIYLMRGTPLMLQIMFIYYGLPLIFDLQISDFPAAILAFVANYAAYFAEIYRGGIESIPKGQKYSAAGSSPSAGGSMRGRKCSALPTNRQCGILSCRRW